MVRFVRVGMGRRVAKNGGGLRRFMSDIFRTQLQTWTLEIISGPLIDTVPSRYHSQLNVLHNHCINSTVIRRQSTV